MCHLQLHFKWKAKKCKHFSKKKKKETQQNKHHNCKQTIIIYLYTCGQNKLYQCTTNKRGLHFHQSDITKAENLNEEFKFFTWSAGWKSWQPFSGKSVWHVSRDVRFVYWAALCQHHPRQPHLGLTVRWTVLPPSTWVKYSVHVTYIWKQRSHFHVICLNTTLLQDHLRHIICEWKNKLDDNNWQW